MNPNVRDREISLTKEVVEKSSSAFCGPALEDRVIEINHEPDLESVKRVKPCPLVALLDLHRPGDPDEPLGRILLNDPGRLHQEDEGACTAVHDGHFRGTDIHVRIVYAQACHCREQMLDRGNAHTLGHQRRGQAGIAHILGTGLDLKGRIEVDTPENDPGIHGGRAQCQVDFLAGV